MATTCSVHCSILLDDISRAVCISTGGMAEGEWRYESPSGEMVGAAAIDPNGHAGKGSMRGY